MKIRSENEFSKKHPVRHIFYLAAGILVGLLAVYIFYWMAHLAYTGSYFSPNLEGTLEVIAIDPGSPTELMGLKVGDQIIQAGDHKFVDFICGLEVFSFLKPNHPYQIKYKRGASIVTTQLTPLPPVFPYPTMIGLIISALYLALGSIVYKKKSSDPSARIFCLMMLCNSSGFAIFFNFQAFWNPAGMILFAFFWFINPLSLHFFLIFPERKKIISRYPALLWIIYIPIFAFLSAGTFLTIKTIQMHLKGGNDPTFFYYFMYLAKFLLGIHIVFQISSFIALTHTFFTTSSSETKKQLQWIFYGFIIALPLLVLSFYKIHIDLKLFLSGGRVFSLILLCSLIFMFTQFLAIFKFRLMDIDIIIHRSLSYFLVSGVTILIYFLLFGIFSGIFEFLTGKNTIVTYVISALIVAFMFRPLLIRIEQAIDRLFYQEKYALHQALGTVSEALITVRDPLKIFQKVYETIEKTLHIQSGVLFLQDENEKTLKQLFSLPEKKSQPLLSIAPSPDAKIHPNTQGPDSLPSPN